jgi:hypothetical protein
MGNLMLDNAMVWLASKKTIAFWQAVTNQPKRRLLIPLSYLEGR